MTVVPIGGTHRRVRRSPGGRTGSAADARRAPPAASRRAVARRVHRGTRGGSAGRVQPAPIAVTQLAEVDRQSSRGIASADPRRSWHADPSMPLPGARPRTRIARATVRRRRAADRTAAAVGGGQPSWPRPSSGYACPTVRSAWSSSSPPSNRPAMTPISHASPVIRRHRGPALARPRRPSSTGESRGEEQRGVHGSLPSRAVPGAPLRGRRRAGRRCVTRGHQRP